MKIKLTYEFLIAFFLFCAIVSALGFSISPDDQSNELYKKGIEALKARDTLQAEKFFKESIRENADAPSYFELAKIYLNRNTYLSRNFAYEDLRMAVLKEPNNIEYKYLYAKICQDFARFAAFDQYYKILALDSNQVAAWIDLAEMKEKDFSEYNNSVRAMGDEFYGPLQEYADQDFAEAEKFFKHALAVDSTNYDAILKLSLLYEKAGRPAQGIPFLKRLIKNNKADKEVHLCLGLLYYQTYKIKESYEEYKNALQLMNEDEKKDFTFNSVKFLLKPAFDDTIKKMNDDELKEFIDLYWKFSDPLNLTEYNERLLEHYSRVAYANLYFSVPKMGIVGWKSNRGEIVLRYGEPLNVVRIRPQMGDSRALMKTDVWNYKDMTFGFSDMASSGNFLFASPAGEKDKVAPQYGGDSQTDIENLRKVRYTYYEPKFDGPKFDVQYNIAQLKSYKKRNHIDLIVSYTLAAAESLRVANDYRIDHDMGIFIFDKNYEEIISSRKHFENFSVANDLIYTPKEKLLVNTVDVQTLPDSGYVALEIRRTADNGTSANREKINIRKFSNTHLDISDLFLLSRIDTANFSDHFVKRNNLYLQPNPTNQFDKDHQPNLYYEVYNLSADSRGLTNFEQKIIVSEFREEEGFSVEQAVKSVLDVLGIGKDEKKVTLTSTYQTQEKDPQIYFQFDLSKYPAGKYLIVVVVKDNLSGKEVQTKSVIDWMN